MKKRTLLFGIAGLVAVALFAGFISYTTGTTTAQENAQKTQVETTTAQENAQKTQVETTAPAETTDTQALKKESCGCCAERKARVRELIRRARESRQRENNVEVKASINKGNGK